MEVKENRVNVSRKELLAEYRQSKLKKESQPQVKTLKKKVSSAAQSRLGKPQNVEFSKPQSNRPTKAIEASKQVTSRPLQTLVRKSGSSNFGGQKLSESASISNIFEKLREAELLANASGIDVARTFMQSIPDNVGFEHITAKAIYWLTWIKLETSYHEWDRVETLFARANCIVTDTSDRRAISAAYESFKVQADAVLAAKFNDVAQQSQEERREDTMSEQPSLGDLLGFTEQGDETEEGACYFVELLISCCCTTV